MTRIIQDHAGIQAAGWSAIHPGDRVIIHIPIKMISYIIYAVKIIPEYSSLYFILTYILRDNV